MKRILCLTNNKTIFLKTIYIIYKFWLIYIIFFLHKNNEISFVPAFNGKWEIRETPTPKPSANQVLIKVRSSGLCYSDVHITTGELPFPINFHVSLGMSQ